jgi:hypothetical protein
MIISGPRPARLKKALLGKELVAERQSCSGDLELSDARVVRATSSLEHGDGTLYLGVTAEVLE